jgi:hypothetical protein
LDFSPKISRPTELEARPLRLCEKDCQTLNFRSNASERDCHFANWTWWLGGWNFSRKPLHHAAQTKNIAPRKLMLVIVRIAQREIFHKLFLRAGRG